MPDYHTHIARSLDNPRLYYYRLTFTLDSGNIVHIAEGHVRTLAAARTAARHAESKHRSQVDRLAAEHVACQLEHISSPETEVDI